MTVQLVGFTNLMDPEPWAVKGTVGGLTVLWGPYGSWKTFASVSIALSVSTGLPWFGKPVRQGPVLYVLGEGGTELFKRRVSAAAAEMGLKSLKEVPLWMTTSAIDMSVPAKLEPVWEEWDEISPVLVVVDTVSRALVGDENKQEVMQAFVASMDAIRTRYSASVLAVHHANRQGQIRGSNVLPSAADVVLRVSKSIGEHGHKVMHLKADKLKDLNTDDFEPKQLFPNVVKVRHEDGSLMVDEFGDQITTIVLKEDGEVLEREATALAILEHLAKGRDKDKAIGYKEWLEASGQPATTFKRAVGGLVAAGKVSQPARGQYFVGDRKQQFFEPGDNFDTTSEEEVRQKLAELEEEVEW